MEYISLNFVKNNVLKQYGKQKVLKTKINNYFGTFFDKHYDISYFWVNGKAYVKNSFSHQLKKELEKLLNKKIRPFYPKRFPDDLKIEERDSVYIKRKIEEKNKLLKEKKELKRNNTKKEFLNIIENIKQKKAGFRYIGAFDLEFWEQDISKILEFGWCISNYKDEISVTHLVVQENLQYKNGIYSKNNRFARKDTKIVSLETAIKSFKEEFLDKIDILIGHGLENDLKVLELNNLKLDKQYLDTSDIGAILLNKDNKISLENLLQQLDIQYSSLHNAATDAEYLLKAFIKMGDLK